MYSKDGVEVEELIQDLEKMISGIEHVKSFHWYDHMSFFFSSFDFSFLSFLLVLTLWFPEERGSGIQSSTVR
jgi:hypothetical protein